MQANQIQGRSAEVLAEPMSDPRRTICEQTVRICTERFGQGLRAVVLTGSLARDEGTFAGDRTLLGDADFFLVFHKSTRLPGTAEMQVAEREIKDALERLGLTVSVGLGPVDTSYLQRMPPHISTFELRSRGCVVWGDSDILSLIPSFPAANISREDAWRLLANRIIELLEAIASSTRRDDLGSHEIQYRTIKLFLDMATSYLVFTGGYLPTYRDRELALKKLVKDPVAQAEAPFELGPFAELVSACTQFKLERGNIRVPFEKLSEDAPRYASLLWQWELKRLTGETRDLSGVELMLSWMTRQPVKARVRGWASVLRRSGWHRSWREWPRWLRLGWRASPRYWVYSVAAEVFFRSPGLNEPRRENSHEIEPACNLPLREPPSTMCGVHLLDLAELTAINYRRFLEATTA